MLTLDREQTTALDYSVVNTSIQETFTAIDRFEWQAIDELRDYWAVAQEYEVIKQDYWAELTTQETDLITALQKASLQPRTIGVGSIVSHADPYRTLYVERHWCQVKKIRVLSSGRNSMVKLKTVVLRLVMSKPRKKQGNPDFRHRVTVPAPSSQEIESRLFELITPGTFANLKGVKDKERNLRRRSPP